MYEPKSLLGCRAGIACASLIVLGVVACDNPQPPTSCGPLPQVTVNAGESTTVTACFNDPNGDMLSYSATSSNPGVATASISGTSVTVRAVAPGNASVTVTAADPEGLQGQQSFQVTVPNRPPQPRGTIPSVSVPVGEPAWIDVSSYFTEPDGEALTYGATSSNPAVATVTVAGSRVTVTAVAKGTSNVTVTATDPGGLTATQTFQFTVPNRDPEAVGTIPDQTVEVDETTTVDLTSFFEDPDGDPLTYAAASSRSAVARGSVSGSILTVSAVAPGTATLTVTARDNDGASVTQRFDVTVPQPNRAPRRVGTIPAQTLAPGGRTTIDASRYFSDPDGDALRYTATSSNSGVATASVSGSTVTITAVATGSATITVTARDPEGLTAAQPARVTVSQANRAPRRVGTIPARTMNPGGTATVDASRYFSDPDNDALTYTATSSNSGVARASVSGSRVTVRAVSSGSATVTVTARDPGGLSATQRFSVTVRSAGAPDLVVSVSPTSVNASPGDTIEVFFTVRNQGTAAGSATMIRVLESSDSNISTRDQELGTFPVPALAAARSDTTGIGIRLSRDASGTFYFGACVDAVSGESDTQNNCSPGVRVTVGGSGGADLEFGPVTPRTVVISRGISFQIRTTLRNSGSTASPPTKVTVHLSDNSTISTSDLAFPDTLDISGLAPSERVNITSTLRFTGSGTGYIGYCVKAVPGESDTTNNCSGSTRVTVIFYSSQAAGSSASSTSLVIEEAVLRLEPVRVPDGERDPPGLHQMIEAAFLSRPNR